MDIESWEKHQRWLHSRDQSLTFYRALYMRRLNDAQRKSFKQFVERSSSQFPETYEGYAEKQVQIGCDWDLFITNPIKADCQRTGKVWEIDPQLLLEAIEKWDNGEDYIPPVELLI